MPVRVHCGELHARWVLWLRGTLALAGDGVQCELVDISRSNRGVGQPHLILKGHVELWAQANCIEDDSTIVLDLGIAKMKYL